jgi:hypothetical protein
MSSIVVEACEATEKENKPSRAATFSYDPQDL